MISRAFLFAIPVLCSFMALGPPAAPEPLSLGSALPVEQHYRMLDLDSLAAPFANISSVSRIWNNSSHSGLGAGEFSADAVAAGYWWMADPKFSHKQPYASGTDYKVFRNVRDYGASGNGDQDDAPYIMKAIMDGNRCGANCNATSTKGAVIYFPPGTYRISTPILQYYYTVFIGDPNSPAIIKGASDFKGIALIDTDFYIPNGDGGQWWTNQNNFYRQIRNFKLDMTDMPSYVEGGAVENWPVGIHWQVSQACTLQNIQIVMPLIGQGTEVRHRGIFMENGSGGFISEISFVGGRVGFVAGSQQYTARKLRFTSTERAIDMLWDWGFVWKSIEVINCRVGINATTAGRDENTRNMQSTGSLTILDSSFKDVENMLIIGSNIKGYQPNVVIDNVKLDSVAKSAVIDNSGNELLAGGSQTVQFWALGQRYTDQEPGGELVMGPMEPPRKDKSLLHGNNMKFFENDKPQYWNQDASAFLNVLDYGVSNDGSYPNNNAENINSALVDSAGLRKILVFPAGVYKVDDTIFVPPGARIVGVLWSQIMATGKAFSDPRQPRAVVQVGKVGDKGIVEISDMTITNDGATAGAKFIEWNIHEDNQGSAAIWDTVVRVGGAVGTGLTERTCHQFGKQQKEKCMASTMMLHVTSQASIYMENVWLWVADHDIDSKEQTRVNVYGARGALIESQGPSWFHSVSNEHSTLYNWQLSRAKNVYFGHIQSETPYFQAGQSVATEPFVPGSQRFLEDPDFSDCAPPTEGPDTCQEAWALRILHSRNVYLYGGGFYSFFKNYDDSCAKFGQICQDKLIDTSFSENIWLFNLFTVGAKEVISPQGLDAVKREDNLNGFATATSVWAMLANQGARIGGTRTSLAEEMEDDEESGSLMCDPTRKFDSMEALERASGDMPIYCRTIYLMQVLSKMIDDALAKYEKIDNGYDGLFEKYTKAFREYMAQQLADFMSRGDSHNPSGEGRQYFSCKLEAVGRVTVGRCDKAAGTPNDAGMWSLTMTLDKPDEFYDALMKKTGIDRSWIYLKPSDLNTHSDSTPVGKETGMSNPVAQWTYNAPALLEKFPVPNPKDIFKRAVPNAQALQVQMAMTRLEMKMSMYSTGDPTDAVQVYSVPAFLMAETIDRMEEVRKIGGAIKKEEKKNLILTILTSVFAIVPFIGELGAMAAGLGQLARMISVLGWVGNTALGVTDAVLHPEMAPLAIVGILLGGLPGGRTTAEDMKKMALLRKGITADIAKGMGKTFARNDDILQRVARACVRR